MRLLLRFVMTATVLGTAAVASSQPATAAMSQSWSTAAGVQTFSFRDVSRTSRPPDASPITWRGAGVFVGGHAERSGTRVAHLGDVLVARASNFSYESPILRTAAPSADLASRMDLRYEYRRYFFRDVGMRGVDIGTGLQGIAARIALDRHITDALVNRSRLSGGGAGIALSMRVRRWQRAQASVTYVNGAVATNVAVRHSADPEARSDSSGGFWFTDLAGQFDWRLTPAVRVSAAWRHGFEGFHSPHFHFAADRQVFSIGAIYGR